jgi:intracellular septation protein
MQFFNDLFPVIAFFIVYKVWGSYWGTFALIVASAIQLILMQIKQGFVKPMYWVSFLLILIFGGLTIFFRDPMFLKWKVSIINWLMGAAFLVSHFFKRTVLEIFVKQTDSTPLPVDVLRRINSLWGYFFLFLGTLNLYIAYHYSTNTWVNFKVFGIFGLTIIFVVLQTFYLLHLIKPRK